MLLQAAPYLLRGKEKGCGSESERRSMISERKYPKTVVLNLGPPDVLGLQLPEILASRGGGEGFWEL